MPPCRARERGVILSKSAREEAGKTVDIREAQDIGRKIVEFVVNPRDRRLTGRGADRATVGETLVHGMIAALVTVFRALPVGDDEELVTALRKCLRDFDEAQRR